MRHSILGFVFLASFWSIQNFAAKPSIGFVPADVKAKPLFGTTLFFQSPSAEVTASLESTIEKASRTLGRSWDPDCVYRDANKSLCPPDFNEAETKPIDALAEQIKKETDGNFSAMRTIRGQKRRDFGGIAQGMFLEQYIKPVNGPVFANFAGDVFVSKAYPKNELGLTIANPFFPLLTFGKAELNGGGWMITSVAPMQGSRIEDPKTGFPVAKPDFDMVVLFAHPSFHGGRLDAWATAIVVGGENLLQKLFALPEYKGKWGYLTISKDFSTKCSPNINCNFADPNARVVQTSF